MATIKLISLECIRRHDPTGVDEPAIKFEGSRVWSGVISKGETTSLRGQVAPQTFSSSLLVSLHEVSNGITHQIAYAESVRDHPTNKGLLVFKTSGTHYELRYEVDACG